MPWQNMAFIPLLDMAFACEIGLEEIGTSGKSIKTFGGHLWSNKNSATKKTSIDYFGQS